MIEIKDIEFGYRSKKILHNISFSLYANEEHLSAFLQSCLDMSQVRLLLIK